MENKVYSDKWLRNLRVKNAGKNINSQSSLGFKMQYPDVRFSTLVLYRLIFPLYILSFTT